MAKHRETPPEFALRSALHRRGLRYRVAYPLPGQHRRTIDVAFTHHRLAVFVDGGFWHGCAEHGTSPRQNFGWRRTTPSANPSRARDTDAVLASLGWRALRAWEHEPPERVADEIRRVLSQT